MSDEAKSTDRNDPYAPPHTGIYRSRVAHAYLGIAADLVDSPIAVIAYRDFLARRFSEQAGQVSVQGRGTGVSIPRSRNLVRLKLSHEDLTNR